MPPLLHPHIPPNMPLPPAAGTVQVPLAPYTPHRRILIADSAPAIDLLVRELRFRLGLPVGQCHFYRFLGGRESWG